MLVGRKAARTTVGLWIEVSPGGRIVTRNATTVPIHPTMCWPRRMRRTLAVRIRKQVDVAGSEAVGRRLVKVCFIQNAGHAIAHQYRWQYLSRIIQASTRRDRLSGST